MTLPEAIAIVTALALDNLLKNGGTATEEQALALAHLENYGMMVEDKESRYSHGPKGGEGTR